MKINLPKSWEDIYVDQFIALKKMDDSESSFFIKQIKILAILTDTLPNDEMWEDLDVELLTDYIKKIKWLNTEPSNQFKKNIDEFTCIDINKLSFGEFIDLEHYFGDNQYYDNIYKICAIFYRKTKVNEWGHLEFEPYEFIDIDERASVFEDLKITDIYGIMNYFFEFKELIQTTYANHFEPIIEDTDEEVEYDIEEQAEIEKEKILSKWGWENIIYKLAKGDITKYDELTKLPIIFIFNHLSYIKDMNLEF